VTVEDGQLLMRTRLSGPIAEFQGDQEQPARYLRPVDRELFYLAEDGDEGLVSFLEFEQGRPGYLFTGRAARRV
jgi:hypothetical protein